MPVVYRKLVIHVCQLLDDHCIQAKGERLPNGSPNCKVGCLIYRKWDKSGLKARDYAHQKSVEDYNEEAESKLP